jgi:peptide/nickel transport system permease protein
MTAFLLRRGFTFLVTLLAASLVVFIVLEILPGNPAQVIMGMEAPQSAVEALAKQLGLDRPPHVRYFSWLAGLAEGRMGFSFTYQVPVEQIIGQRIQVTFPLALMAIVIAIATAIPLGIYAAARHNKPGDYGMMLFSQIGIAVPSFWLAILLTIVFAIKLQWLPSGGFPGWDAGFWPAFRSLLLPAIALGLIQAAILARITRSAVLEAYREDFVRTARAKGLSRRATLWRHVLRNALLPVVTILGLELASLLVGTIVVEQVFFLPGLGRLVFQSIGQRDLIVVKNVVLLLAALVILVNFVVDLLYLAIDPRLRAARR